MEEFERSLLYFDNRPKTCKQVPAHQFWSFRLTLEITTGSYYTFRAPILSVLTTKKFRCVERLHYNNTLLIQSPFTPSVQSCKHDNNLLQRPQLDSESPTATQTVTSTTIILSISGMEIMADILLDVSFCRLCIGHRLGRSLPPSQRQVHPGRRSSAARAFRSHFTTATIFALFQGLC